MAALMQDPADPIPPPVLTVVPTREASLSYLTELAADARPAEVSDGAKRKLFDDWGKAGGYIQRAEQMRLDAIKEQAKCAEAIVKKLGAGLHRYKDKLYVVSVSKRGVVYLREAVARKNG